MPHIVGCQENSSSFFEQPDNMFRVFAKVVGPSYLESTRGTTITIRSETSASSCSTTDITQATASYSWGLVSSTEPLENEMFDQSRDPRVLVIPRHTLGFAGNNYVFQLAAEFGGVSNVANVTGELVLIPYRRRRGPCFGRGLQFLNRNISRRQGPSSAHTGISFDSM